MRWKKCFKAVSFISIFTMLFSLSSKILNTNGDYRNYQWIAGFYEEPSKSLDAVYIGSSTVYTYWNPLTAWNQYGLAIYPYTSNAQPFIATEYLIKEVRKTQPNALFIVNTNTIDNEIMTVERLHHTFDYMPLSINKFQLIHYLSKVARLNWKEEMELHVPLYRYHSRWSKVVPEDFLYKVDGLKGVSSRENYMSFVEDVSDKYEYSFDRVPLPSIVEDAAVSLMDYCEREKVNILFVTVPRAETLERIQQLNTLNAMLDERGFSTLNLLAEPNALLLDLEQDFYNVGHTNVHGSVKYTQYLCEYLIEHYGFEDKHGNAAYASWEEGYQKYEPLLKQYTLDLEYELSHRTNHLEKPQNLSVSSSDLHVLLSWNASADAEGYEIYRRGKSSAWEFVAKTEELYYLDSEIKPDADVNYTVVPYCLCDGEKYYGKFDYAGVCIQNQEIDSSSQG